jgi:endonuclease I
LTRQRRLAAVLVCAALLVRSARADEFDPPPGYYSAANGTGAELKSQLHTILKSGHTPISYDDMRRALQITDADPNNPGRMLLVYDRVSLNVAAINPGGPIPGWDNGTSWNREHTWPISRGLGSESVPDGSDLHHLRPSTPSVNSDRANLNFGGEFGAQPFGVLVDNGATVFYPGDADAGMIARHEFYMAVRYDGSQAGTTNLELVPGSPAETSALLGDLNRMVEWHYAAPPDAFERRRNQIIYESYQNNRNPFIDRPEFVWSVFVDQANDSGISIDGAAAGADGGSTRSVDLGRMYVGGSVPAPQTFTLNKAGNDGTYYEVTTADAATSSLTGRFNAFRTGGPDSETITVGLSIGTTTSGLKTGAVTIDNLDITTNGGADRGANDANDVFNVSLAVLDHPVASYSDNVEQRERVIDFGIVPAGSGPLSWASVITNLAAFGAPDYAANLEFDGIAGMGGIDVFQVNLDPFTGLDQGDRVVFDSVFSPTSLGEFSANYMLTLSGEDLPGDETQMLTLSLTGRAVIPGDYNANGVVDAADYVLWRRGVGQNVIDYRTADGNGDRLIDGEDYDVWRANFGAVAAVPEGAILGSTVPEPANPCLTLVVLILCRARNRR